MLAWPPFRITSFEAINHRYFNSISDQVKIERQLPETILLNKDKIYDVEEDMHDLYIWI